MRRDDNLFPLVVLVAIAVSLYATCYAMPKWCASRGGRLVVMRDVGCILPESKAVAP